MSQIGIPKRAMMLRFSQLTARVKMASFLAIGWEVWE
jgi:hypothetical protein